MPSQVRRRPRPKRTFGSVRKLGPDRYQARYTAPDGKRYPARDDSGHPIIFGTKTDADAWLSIRHSEILRKQWVPPGADPEQGSSAAPLTLRAYVGEPFDTGGSRWLARRELRVRVFEQYSFLLVNHIYPVFGDIPLTEITSADVEAWYAKLGKPSGPGPTARKHAYGLLRTILNSAARSVPPLIPANPCTIDKAGQAKRVKRIILASVDELESLVKAMPGKYQLMVLLAAWCAPRFGELCELRRNNVDLTSGLLRIRWGVVRTSRRGRVVEPPKTEAGDRDVHIPPHLLPAIQAHLDQYVKPGKDALLFPGQTATGHLSEKTFREHWERARTAAGRPDLTPHILRHVGATMAAQAGASIKELMARLGHTTPHAAMIYQHAAAERDQLIAQRLSEMASGRRSA